MSKAILLAWSLSFTISILVLILLDGNGITTTFQIEPATAQNQANATYAMSLKGISLVGLYKYNEAIKLFDKVLAIDPNDAKTLTDKGKVLDDLGMHQEAIQYY